MAAAVRPPLHPTHYECLGVDEGASAAAIDAAWQRDVARRTSSDGSRVAPADPALRLAHAVLSDPERRAVYDRWVAGERGWQQSLRASSWQRGTRRALLVLTGAVLVAGLAYWCL